MYDEFDYNERRRNAQHETADEFNPVGRQRPIANGPNGHKTPVPWIGGVGPQEGNWSYVEGRRAKQADANNLCLVCGLKLEANWVYALFQGQPYDSIRDGFYTPPSPTYGHPNCILTAALYCPHLKKQEYPAMTQDRLTKLSVDDLKVLAREDRKTLKAKPESFAAGSAAFSPRIKRDKALTR